MWVLHLTNFGQCWHFNTYEEALKKGQDSGFEYTIYRE